MLHLSLIKVTAYFTKIVKEIITHRQMNNVTRNDIMQTLIDLKYKETKMKDALPQNKASESNDIGIRKTSHFLFNTFILCSFIYNCI